MHELSNLPIPKSRQLFLIDQIDQVSIEKLYKDILEIDENDEFLKKVYSIYNLKYEPNPIELYIDSFGGSVYQIFGLISIIEKCKTPIYTIATGAAMSAGFLLLIHGNKRFAYKNASIMVHQVSDGSWGTYEKIKTDLKETKRLHDVIKKMIISKTNIKPEKLDKVFKSQKDWYLDVDQAIKLKIIDAIL